MTTAYQTGSAPGYLNNDMENGEWVRKDSLQRIPGHQTQLLFNLALPCNALNRATRVGPPGPIVIEKLVVHQERQDNAESCSGSLHLSVLSEDQLQTAVRLAKKDLRRKHQQSVNSLSHRTQDTRVRTPSPDQQNVVSSEGRRRAESSKRPAQVLVHTPQKLLQPAKAGQGQSPPTRDSGPKSISSEPQLSREIHKLQKELEAYVHRVEQLVNKGQLVESVEPDEKLRIEIRKQEQATRFARIIYCFQQQVKEIQEDLDKLHSQSVRPTNKYRALNRLAAAHRGAVRVVQAFIQQLSDPAESRVPVQCKELGQLVRKLSLCSAKVEVGQGSTVPQTTLDILHQLEKLDSVLSKQDSQQEEPCMGGIFPLKQRTSKVDGHSLSRSHFPQAQTAKATQQPRKSSAPKKKRRMAGQPLKPQQLMDQKRKEVLKAGIQNLVRMQERGEGESRNRPEMGIPKSSSSADNPDKSKPSVDVRNAGFQQSTVSSKLRESHLPQRETSVPWIPTSPHSTVKQRRTVSTRPEPRCLFSSVKNSSQPMGVQDKNQCQGKTNTENIRNVQNDATGQAWVDTLTENRQRALGKEEMLDVHRLRVEASSSTQWTEGTEQETREKLQPLQDCVQNAVSSDVETTTGPVQRFDKDYDTLLQDPILENMLLRMEEIEKDEEEVRRRFAMISYSDPLLWEMNTESQRKHYCSRPASPQPIRLTKPAHRLSGTGEIVLQRPVETGAESENLVLEEEPLAAVSSCQTTDKAQNQGGVLLTVPCNIQENIQSYREKHDSYLRLVHAAVGSFNPCAVAESLAEELLMEALADVASEFQDVCEEYAEAIFTSEFLQPIPSPPSFHPPTLQCDQ